jgi:hypothetical protein
MERRPERSVFEHLARIEALRSSLISKPQATGSVVTSIARTVAATFMRFVHSAATSNLCVFWFLSKVTDPITLLRNSTDADGR